jgi:hypothetical protein
MNSELVKFIKEARKRGFSDIQIKEPLIKEGWSASEVNEALQNIPKPGKERIAINLDRGVIEIIKKRAKKNFLTLEEQIEDIVRRSCVNQKKLKAPSEKIDDLLLSIFSRKRTGRKKELS